ncbi:hypothetical protein L7F22_066654 [Adiantum nelumboides]|nr:hypothetical protein [Adiantum nelumboides]
MKKEKKEKQVINSLCKDLPTVIPQAPSWIERMSWGNREDHDHEGGEEQYLYCTDSLVLFRQESYFAYLFGVKEPGFFGALDVGTCQAFLFIPRLPPEYEIWSGKIHSPTYFKDLYKVDVVLYVDEMKDFFTQRRKVEKGLMLYLLHGLNTDSNNYSKPAHFEVSRVPILAAWYL